MVKPSSVGGFGITFSGKPEPAVFGPVHSVVFRSVVAVFGRPVGFSRPSCFVSNPSGLPSNSPKYAIRADFMDGVTKVGGIIISGTVNAASSSFTAIIAVAAIRTIKPHFELVGAILCKFCALP